MANSAAPKARGSQGAGRRASGRPRGRANAWLLRWWKVALLVLIATLGLPLAHALFGEVVALLGCAALLGFLVGRWTAR